MSERFWGDAHRQLLLAIAREKFGIPSFEVTGKPTAEVRLVRVTAVEAALEDACDFGFMLGHNVSRASCRLPHPVALDSQVERGWVREAANDLLDKYSS